MSDFGGGPSWFGGSSPNDTPPDPWLVRWMKYTAIAFIMFGIGVAVFECVNQL